MKSRADLEGFIEKVPFAKELHLKITSFNVGVITITMEPHEHLMNHLRTYQAAALFGFAELTGGVLLGTFLDLAEVLVVTRNAAISFFKNSSSQIFAEALLNQKQISEIKRCLAEKKKLIFPIDIRIRTANNDVLAHCRVEYYIRAQNPGILLRRADKKGRGPLK